MHSGRQSTVKFYHLNKIEVFLFRLELFHVPLTPPFPLPILFFAALSGKRDVCFPSDPLSPECRSLSSSQQAAVDAAGRRK